MNDHYMYKIRPGGELGAYSGEYIGACPEFPSLYSTAATPEEAFAGIRLLVNRKVADMTARNETVPIAFADRQYTGTFVLRVGASTHRNLTRQAKEQGVSLNILVKNRLEAAVQDPWV